MQEERSIRDLLEKMFDNYHMSDKLLETNLLANWEELMGRTIARYTRKIWIRSGVLHLSIDSPALKNDLIYHEAIIIEKVNQFAGRTLIQSVKIH
ncbi:MAG: DUF721 domain-containing protein [Bacteroidetes bacterium]|nr:DUF721 domain-containing protein [Bacteroidota bacterium]